jgi:hypothetical protein
MLKKSLIIKLIVISVLFVSCADDDSVYKIGDQFTKGETKINYVDTLTITASSLIIDSFPTSGYNKVFVGYNVDAELGTSVAESYIEFSAENTIPTFDETTSFDSLVLYIKQTSAYTGDTLIEKSLGIYQVIETIEPRDDGYYLYNTDTMATNSEAIGKLTFKQRPGRLLESNVRLSDSLGNRLFQWILTDTLYTDNDTVLFNSDNFIEYFNGIALKPLSKDVSWSSTFTGESTTDASSTTSSTSEIQLRLYYRLKYEENNTYYAFTPTGSDKIFTHFNVDRTGSLLNAMVTSESISSKETNHQMFVQAGTKVGFRIDIPMINKLKEINANMSVMDAQLVFKPVKGTYTNTSELPSMLVYWIDDNNDITEQLTDVSGQYAITSSLTADNEYNENTQYSFNVLNFILYKMDQGIYSDESLFFTLSGEDNATSFKKVVLEDQSNAFSLQLQMHYVVY